MLLENNNSVFLSETELTSAYNFAIKESYDIIADEVGYYFESKEHLIDIFIEELNFEKLSQKYLQDRFIKVICSPKESESFFKRFEVRLQKELAGAFLDVDLDLSKIHEGFSHIRTSYIDIDEEIRTYFLSCFTEKTVDKIWKKTCSGFIPPALNKVAMNIKVGEYFLTSVRLTAKEIETNIAVKLRKRLQGILKNHKNELIAAIRNEVLTQLLKSEDRLKLTVAKHDIVKTA